jgi:hypothetical protein
MGGWRTAVYLEADPDAYPMLASVWRSVFSGPSPTPEAIHVLDLVGEDVHELARDWAFPLGAEAPQRGEYRHPFDHQTLLSSPQLAAYVHLPSLEVLGYWVDVIPRFDVSTVGAGEPGSRLGLGAVVAHARGRHESDADSASEARSGPPFSISLPGLSRHAFIAGVTGSGKTNTSLQLLRGLHAAGVPFLVIEPAKREYRELAAARQGDSASERLARDVRVFSVSIAEGTPFRINPFEVELGTSVGEHIDLLRSVFAASFGDMWTPLPQVLEQCMRRVYEDRGWDLTSDRNHRLLSSDDRALAFPTMRDLAGAVDAIVDRLGFDPEARDRVRGSLATRINSLRVGSKGAIFDHRSAFSLRALLEQPAILELERLADESDKAFLIGLLIVRLVEFRRAGERTGRAAASGDRLGHLLVIEEAHRLLANVTEQSGSGDNTARALAIESFSNLLAEIRTYGQGIMVIDQVPTKLAPDVIKNTNLKIAHRVVDRADREVLGGSMAMNEAQVASLASLARGEAAVFGDGDDAPVLVRVTPPDPCETERVDPSLPTEDAAPLHWGCACTGAQQGAPECGTAGTLIEQREIRHAIVRIATAALLTNDGHELSASELVQAVRRTLPRGGSEPLVIACLAGRGAEWLADAWGARRSWSFGGTLEFAGALRRLLVDALIARTTDRADVEIDALDAYRRSALGLHERHSDPYPGCSAICSGELAGHCLYRDAAASTLERTDMLDVWRDARVREDPQADGYPRTWATCFDRVAPEMLGPGVQRVARRAAALCFAQQAVAAESPAWPPWARQQFVMDLVELADGGFGTSIEPVALEGTSS